MKLFVHECLYTIISFLDERQLKKALKNDEKQTTMIDWLRFLLLIPNRNSIK